MVIADADAQRARRLAQVCAKVEIAHQVVPHGAAALELALDRRPMLVIAPFELPVVEGLKLAEILRANPRTRSTRFIFLGPEETWSSALREVGDLILPAEVEDGDVFEVIQGLMRRQDRIDSLEAETQGGGEARGDLTQLSLAELLHLFHLNRNSGCVRVKGRKQGSPEEVGWILLRQGEIIQAQIGSIEGEKAVLRMLAYRQGQFNFDSGEPDDPPKVLTPTRTLLAEGMRQLGEWERLADQLPALDAQVKLRVKTGDLPNIVHPLTQEVLLLLELYTRVSDVVDQCSFPDYQVLRTLHTLAVRKIVELGKPTAPRAPQTTKGLFDQAQSRRLGEWLQPGGTKGGIPTAGKLLLVGSNPTDAPEFVSLLGRVPGIELTPAAQQGRIAPGDLVRVGAVNVDGGVAFDLIHVPIAESCTPLWPVVGHASLGTLFLLSGGVGEAAERVKRVADTLRELPRSRIFHVVLLHKDQRISPDELRENLSLIDEASLFLLPLESDREPAALLRSLFARVVP